MTYTTLLCLLPGRTHKLHITLRIRTVGQDKSANKLRITFFGYCLQAQRQCHQVTRKPADWWCNSLPLLSCLIMESPKTYFRIHHMAKVFCSRKCGGKRETRPASWHIIEAHRRLVYNAVISMAILWLRVLQNFMDSACFWWRFYLQNFCTISERETLNCVFGACWMWDNSKGKP